MKQNVLKNGLLAYDLIGNSSSPCTAVFLHGIVGSKRNWRTPCQQFILKNPMYKGITIDLRGHGDSHSHSNDHTLDNCAQDLTKLFNHLQINPELVCGHSFGGKVVLKYLANIYKTGERSFPKNSWILDSLPGICKI
jgi:pimeloyl-ACP methyl ester carboxylesterase